MNKIFKVIWSKSKQCYIVVSEMAKNHSGKKKIVVASILAAMAVGSDALVTDVSAARASVSLAGGTNITDGTIAIGAGSYSDGTAVGGDGARRVEPGIAIGVDAKAQGNSNVVIGQGAQIIGNSFGVAIGRTAQATDDYGVSVGYNTHADLHGIAMGEQSRAKKTGATSFGVSSRGYGNGAIAVGWQSLAGANVYNENGVPNNDINTDNGTTINDYDKWGDVAIGIRTIATGGNATALGRGATASAANAIAIGGGDGGEPTKTGNTASDNKEKTKATAEKAVAIGYKALASDKNATSIGTDAQATQARATAIGYEVRAVGKNAVAIGSSGENSSRKLNSAGENAISIGTAAQANNNESTAIGKEALASNTNAIALGTGAEGTGNTATAIGYLVKATESNAFAAGSESLASGKNSISIGSTYNKTTNQATGEASIAIGAAAQSKGDGSVALGRNVQVMKEYTTAVGMNITASDNASASTILGYNSYTKANQSVNIGSTVKTEAGGQYSTAIGYTLSVSGKNAIGIGSSDDNIPDDKKLMATGESSIAIGTRAQGKETGATAIGKEAVASNTNTIALGTSAQGTGVSSTAIGNGAQASNTNSLAIGTSAKATNERAIAIGNEANANKIDSLAVGVKTTASEVETVSVGLRSTASSMRSVSLGIETESTKSDAVSVGYLAKAKGLGAIALGRNAVVTAEKSTAVGYDLSITNSGSTNIGYTSTVNANQAISVGARNLVEAGAGYGTALGYFVNISGKNAIGIGSSDDTKNVIASTKNAIAIGTSAQSHGTSGIALGDNAVVGVAEVKDTNGRVTTAAVDAKHGVAIGTNAKVLAGQGSVALGWSTEVNASDVVNSSTDPGATRVSPYLLDNIGEDNSNDKGNGIVAIGTKRTSGGSGFARRLTGVAGAIGDYDAVNLKQLKALESNEWLLRTQNTGDRNPTDVDPQTVNGQTKKRVTLKGSENISISNTNGVVTLNVTNVVKSVATDNTNALDISNTNGAVKINPKLATSVDAAGEANKLVTAGTVKTALDLKVNKADELHVKPGNYTVQSSGDVSLIQENANSQTQGDKGFTIKDVAKKSVVDTLQSDYNTFKMKAITFTGDDNQGVARTLDTTLTVKGGANYTSTTTNTNIRVEKDGTTGLAVKLSDKLTGMKEISGTGSQDLVINNGNTKVTVKAPSNGDNGTVDFGNAKVVASNLDASIKYRANDDAAAKAKSVKLVDGFNFVASKDATTTAEGPKSGLAIKAEDNGKVTFGLDKATREKVDNAADKNLSNLSDAGKDKVKELAGEAAKAAVTVADGINTTVTTDTTTTTGVTTYKVNANDTTVAVNADSLAIAGGDLDATTKVRAYTLDLSDTVKAKLNAINNVGDTASNGRDGVNGTSGATGLTGKDGLNDKTLTDKVNALRNGEAGSVVYTNDAGDRVVKAKDGKYYKADEVKADGTVKTAEENKGKAPEEVKTPQARVVNPNGETTAPTTLSNIADGKVAEGSKEAVNGGQLNTVKTDLATALGGGAKVENGTFTGPTYNITKDDGTGTEAVKNVGDAISKLDGRINNANTALANKGLDFTGNDTTDAGKVHRNLGETLTIKGADNFTRTDAETNNIKVVKNNNDLDVKLAENLGNIKEIAGNGKDNLVIKNGDATITLKPKKDAEGTNPATPATVDFGNAKVVAPNLEASITYRANSAEDANAKNVTLQKGLNFVSGDGTAATAEAAKAGITIAADKDGKVVFGLNEATRNAIDNAADKNLSNLSQDGKDKVADLAKTAARDAVKVTAGNNVTVTSETKDGNTTYTVNGRDTTVKAADNGSVSVTGGTLNAKGEREYTVDLTADAKAELGKISDLNTRLGSAEGKITTLQGDMTKAKDDIAANTKAIDANKEAIAANKNAIADNARDIAANRKDIDANKQGIAENKKQIGENAKAIAKNAEDIKKNVEDTKKNTQDIKKNADAIKANTDRIQTVENRVITAEGKIATNEQAIKDNASAIQSNTKAIGANTTAIAKNANDITKANKEIESLKGNSATKDLNNLTNTGKDTITNLINVTGEHGITVTPSTDTTTRVKTFTAKLNDTVTFGSGDKKITVDGTTGTVTSKAVAADTVKANTVNAKTVQLGDSTGTNTTVTADGIAVTTKNLDGTTSKVEIKNGTVSGLTNTKWDPAKVVTEADRSVVATQGQVKDVTDTLARGRVFVGDTGNTVTVGLGDTLAIKGGSTKALTDDNIGVVSTEAKDGKPATMTVKLAKDVKMKDGSTSYDYYLPEIKTNPDGSKEIVKNADGSVKHQLGKDGNPIRLVTTTVNGEGITIAPVKGLDKPTVSLTADGLDNGGNQIHNVAAGTANTDAATVGQVRAAAHALNNRVNEAGAHAAALAAMNPLSYDPLKKSQVMAGVGSYKGNKALALGVAHYANEDTLFNVGVAVGDGSNMVNAGVTYRFGGEYSAVPERYKGGPISSVYVMQDEVSALKAENAEMKEQMKMLMERIEMLAKK